MKLKQRLNPLVVYFRHKDKLINRMVHCYRVDPPDTSKDYWVIHFKTVDRSGTRLFTEWFEKSRWLCLQKKNRKGQKINLTRQGTRSQKPTAAAFAALEAKRAAVRAEREKLEATRREREHSQPGTEEEYIAEKSQKPEKKKGVWPYRRPKKIKEKVEFVGPKRPRGRPKKVPPAILPAEEPTTIETHSGTPGSTVTLPTPKKSFRLDEEQPGEYNPRAHKETLDFGTDEDFAHLQAQVASNFATQDAQRRLMMMRAKRALVEDVTRKARFGPLGVASGVTPDGTR